MKTAFIISLGILLTLIAWRISQLLSSDAIAMAIGLFLGVLAGVPTTTLIVLASRRDAEDDIQPTIVHYPPPVVYRDQVTPYSNWARRALDLPQLPNRQVEIGILRAALDALEKDDMR